ncbi:hypothetical protein SDC9_100083 [bioreactor metagenome]|uniref:Uncharacterized protein n=1 Tax=bioreactor metagenome TaxID=1076179 RepID=A0A645AK55_9ZZZZ
MMIAPIAATLTSRSIPIARVSRARVALMTMGVPATAAAATISAFTRSCWSNSRSARMETTISSPETPGIAQRRCRSAVSVLIVVSFAFLGGGSLRIDGCRRPGVSVGADFGIRAGLEGGRSCHIAGLGHRSHQVLDARQRRIVVDLNASRGEVHLHRRHAVQAPHLLLDLGHARGAGEALGPQDGACGRSVRRHDHHPFR